MSTRGRITVIDLDHERLSFVSGSVSSGHVRVSRRGSVGRPASVDSASAEALGSWVGEQLQGAGVGSGGRVLVCVPRGNVVMKRLSFPGLESARDPDLVAMVRLQMTRQMPMKVEGTAIDFVPLERTEAAGAGADGPGVEVLACALPGDRVTWCRGVAEAAGVKLGHLSLRASGSATLLAQAGHGVESPVLGVSIGWSSVEFVVVREGEIVFVRSADVALTPDMGAAEYAKRVALEARRTWMSYRVSPGSLDVSRVVAVGAGEVSREVATRCGEALEIDSATVEMPSFVEEDAAGGEQGDGAWALTEAGRAAIAPLVGLMVAQASDRPVFDFANPREAPDTRAGARRVVLLGALGAIVVIGGGLVVADMQVRETRAAARRAEAEAREWAGKVTQHLRVDARAQHLDRWLAADVDWLAHWSKVSQTMPAPPEALMDSFGGTLTRASVVFAPEGSSRSGGLRRYTSQGWGLEIEAQLNATGRIASRSIGNMFRERLVTDPTYVVESRGADTESRFDMNLVTRVTSPVEPGAIRAVATGAGAPNQGAGSEVTPPGGSPEPVLVAGGTPGDGGDGQGATGSTPAKTAADQGRDSRAEGRPGGTP